MWNSSGETKREILPVWCGGNLPPGQISPPNVINKDPKLLVQSQPPAGCWRKSSSQWEEEDNGGPCSGLVWWQVRYQDHNCQTGEFLPSLAGRDQVLRNLIVLPLRLSDKKENLKIVRLFTWQTPGRDYWLLTPGGMWRVLMVGPTHWLTWVNYIKITDDSPVRFVTVTSYNRI